MNLFWARVSCFLRSCFVALVYCGLVNILAPSYSSADDQLQRVGRIRAALIFYIAKFVTWPPGTFQPAQDISLCVLGDDPQNQFLEDTVRGKTVQGRSIRVQFFEESYDGDLKKCHIVFLGSNAFEKPKENVTAIFSAPILTICAAKGVVWGSCLVQLFEADNKARLAVDMNIASKTRLKIDSELLSVAVTN